MFCLLRKILLLFCVSLLTQVLISTPCLAGQSTDGIYTITTDLAGSSGGLTADFGYQLQSSIGQSAQGNISASTHTILAGFLSAGKKVAEPKSNIFLLIIPVITSQAGQ